jgi:hypothetical protein
MWRGLSSCAPIFTGRWVKQRNPFTSGPVVFSEIKHYRLAGAYFAPSSPVSRALPSLLISAEAKAMAGRA